MPKRSKVHSLSSDVKAWLDRELIKRGFGDYETLESLLAVKGIQISKSSIQRYGAELEQQTLAIKASTEAAKAIVAETEDNEGAMGQSLVAMCQQQLFDLFLNAQEGEMTPKALAQLTNAISRISRANIVQKQYAEEVKKKTHAAADKVKELARAGGLNEEQQQAQYETILGIVS